MWFVKKKPPQVLHSTVINQIVDVVTEIGKEVPLGKDFSIPLTLLPEHSSYELERAAARLEHRDMKIVNKYGATLDFTREKFPPRF
jgi:hypothetical protein